MRKYFTEVGLNMCIGYKILVQQDFLKMNDSLSFDPHIYTIGIGL